MERYIDAELIRKLKIACIAKYPYSYADGIFALAREIENIPAADVVEVVRCEKCTHKVDYCGRTMCDRNARRINDGIVGLTATSLDDFCSYGERKD